LKNAPFCPYKGKFSEKITKNAKKWSKNGQKRTFLVKNSKKCTFLLKNGQKRQKMTKNS
jgi:hypothetical protein